MTGTIAEKVTKLLVEELGVDADEVKPEALLRDDLGADSLDSVEIMLALEQEFGVAIEDEDAEGWMTVRDVIAYLETRGVKV